MYQDAGYGENWQPAANNARRIDPYTRSCAALGALFVIGFVLIVIVVLSLIPLYISHNSSSTSSNSQAAKVSVSNYVLRFQSPANNFDPRTILTDTNNRQRLQAALTSMIQKDSSLTGSIVEITTSSTKSNRKRRQALAMGAITFDLNVIEGKACSAAVCANLFQSHVISCLTNSSQTITVRYQLTNSTQIYWLGFKLPMAIQSSVSYISVDLKLIASTLDVLSQLDQTQNQPPIESSTPSIAS